jgi:acyl carrier protein
MAERIEERIKLRDVFRWDIFSVVAFSVCLAIFLTAITVDWFPHNLLIAQLMLAIVVLLTSIKFLLSLARATIPLRIGICVTVVSMVIGGWFAIHAIQLHKKSNDVTIAPKLLPPPEKSLSPAGQQKKTTTTADEIRNLLMNELQVDGSQITPNADLASDLGADPLDKKEIVISIETAYDLQISDRDARKLKTVGDLVSYVDTRLSSKENSPTKTPKPVKPNGVTLGNDSVGYGHLPPGTKVGDRSVYVGPTDEHGNVRIPGGTAVGNGASAGPNGVALGANANAGGTSPQKQRTAKQAVFAIRIRLCRRRKPSTTMFHRPYGFQPLNLCRRIPRCSV